MTARAANVKGIKFLEEPRGANRQGVALVSFDLVNTPYTGGTDTVTLGGAGTENGVATTATLATMLQNRRRDGRTVTITQVMGGPAPGRQLAATNGPDIYVQAATVSAGNLASITLNSAATGGSAVTTTTAAWDAAATVLVSFAAVYPANTPE